MSQPTSTAILASPTPLAPGEPPLRVVPDAVAAARALFARAQFDEGPVARRLGGTTLFGFPRLANGRRTLAGAIEDAQAALVRLLLDGEPLEAARAHRLCGDEGLAALEALGVLVPTDDGALRATVLLAPVQGLYVASDLPGEQVADAVFPALGELTRDFVGALPPAPAGARVLEMCAGTGIAALRYARAGAGECWATDLGARSVHFARFNAALSALDHVTCRVSDGWDALDGETFDLVCAHPPYVPALAHEMDYRDGGADGEQVTRRLVEGLPRHLRPGGRLALTCALSDRRGEPFEQRVRAWLGDAAPEFDLVALQRREWDAMVAYRTSGGRGTDGYRDLERWLAHFDALGIERFQLLALELRRTARGAPMTVRRGGGPVVTAEAQDWVLARARRVAAASGDALARLRGVRPRVVPGVTLDVQLRALDDGWHTTGALARVTHPVLSAITLPALAPTLLELCDGTRDVAALHAALVAAELVDDSVSVHDVAALVDVLLDGAVLECDDLPVPRLPAPAAGGAS